MLFNKIQIILAFMICFHTIQHSPYSNRTFSLLFKSGKINIFIHFLTKRCSMFHENKAYTESFNVALKTKFD
jgi:hypothetical protein